MIGRDKDSPALAEKADAKLPLGKGIGEGIRGFKSAMKAEEEKAINPTTIIANEQSLTNG